MIKLFINEPSDGLTDQSDRIAYSQPCTFSLIRGQRGTASIPLQIDQADGYQSTVGSPIYVHEFVDAVDTIVYAGTINDLDRKWEGNDGVHIDTLTCVSLEQCFDVIRVPPCAYFDMAAGDILTDLFNKYAGGVPVTLGTIQSGATIISLVIRWDALSDLFQLLATQAGDNFIWGVQMSDSTLYFQEQATTPAPFTLESYLYESGDWKQTRSDFRDRQLIQISFTAFSTANEMFAGDGTTTAFSLRIPVDRVVSAMLTTGAQATALGSFGSASPSSPMNPSPGDTFTITPPHNPPVTEDPYTWVDALDNTLRNQVLIGATPEDTCQNTVDALNANPLMAGVTFSLPTWENDACNADAPVGGTFILRVKNPGVGGNDVELTTSSLTFQWDLIGSLSPVIVGFTSGGTDGITNALNVGVADANTLSLDLQYTPGSNVITTNAPIPIGTSLSVAYYRLGGDTIAVEDSALVALRAAAEHGSGKYMQLITDTQNADARSGYIKALNALTAFKTLPASFNFTIDQALLSPGQLLTILITSPTGAPALLDGVWLVQEVQAGIVPGMEELEAPYGHFRYTITVINTNQIGTFVDFWENLAIVSPAGAQTVNNFDIVTASPTLLDGSTITDGTPSAGTPSTTAGQQWVQEQLGVSILKEATDLATDESDNTIVTSASYTFGDADVGRTISIAGTPGWDTGFYTILSVADGAATLSSPPAAAGSTDGHWALTSLVQFQFTWQPTKSQWSGNQIAIVVRISGGTTKQLTPFRHIDVGFHTAPLDPTGGADYAISGDQLTFATAPSDGDIILVEYFPSGPRFIAPTTPGGNDLVAENNVGDFGRSHSDSYAFLASDIGKYLVITGGTDWSLGSFLIQGTASGDALTFETLALSGTMGGIWHISNTP